MRLADCDLQTGGNAGYDSGRPPHMAAALKLLVLTSLIGTTGPAVAQEETQSQFLKMAPIAQYRVASRSEEISLARSAAPASISDDAEILVLGDRGYETAVKGSNGFVCLVERSWFASLSDPVFWDPSIRGPDCLNPAAARTVLPVNLERTKWVLAGLSKTQMLARSRTSDVAHRAPAPGAMGYMMSKQQHLADAVGHWHPHLMFFQPHTALSAWGANLPGSPVMGTNSDPEEGTVFVVPVGTWSDGTSAMSK